MVEGGVEGDEGGRVARCHTHPTQLLLPRLVSGLADAVEVPPGALGCHIGPRILGGGGGEGDLQENRLRRLLQVDVSVVVRHIALLPRRRACAVVDGADRDRELSSEVDPLILCPAGGVAVALHSRVAHLLYLALGQPVPVSSIGKVPDNRRLLCSLGEGEPMQSHPACRRQLYVDAVSGESGGVVARAYHLTAPVGVAPLPARRVIRRPSPRSHLARHWHHRQVEEIPDARSAHVGVGEAYDRAVRDVVAAAPVPALSDGGGAELDHPKGDVCTEEDVPMTSRPDPGVHEVG